MRRPARVCCHDRRDHRTLERTDPLAYLFEDRVARRRVFVAQLQELAAELEEGVIVCILADGGWKYLSAPFWSADDVAAAMEKSLWW